MKSLFSILLVLSILYFTSSFDISFIPANEENPSLPLSAKYRDQLRKLCSIVEKSKTLPKELAEKKEVLNKMCTKLKQDDENVAISNAYTEKATKIGTQIFGVIGVFVAAWAAKKYFNEINAFLMSLGAYFGQKETAKTYTPLETNTGDNVGSVPMDRDRRLNEMRDARLKRFAAATSETNKLD